ncbi:MAG: helix-turn-helix transcriptional regulator [Novosphingobium sp.]
MSLSDRQTLSLRRDKVPDDCSNPRMLAERSPARPGVSFFRDESDLDGLDPAVRRYRAQLASIGFHSFVGARMELEPGRTLLIALHSANEPSWAFDRGVQHCIESFLPHVCRTMRLGARSSEPTEQTAQLLDLLDCGIFMLADNGDVQWQNRAAGQMLDAGRHIRRAGRRLAGGSEQYSDVIRALLASAGAGEMAKGFLGEAPQGHQALAIPLADAGSRSSVALLIFPPVGSRGPLSAAVLSELYRFTGAEALLAAAICEGESTRTFAERKGISIFTARSQLKQVLAKTGTTRQSEMVGLIRGAFSTSLLQT